MVSCVDDVVVDSVIMVEVVVILKCVYMVEVRSEIVDDDFVDVVSCDGLLFC